MIRPPAYHFVAAFDRPLGRYRADLGDCPSNEQGLQALVTQPPGARNWRGPYIDADRAPLDFWSRPLIYRHPSSRPDHDYDLCVDVPPGEPKGGEFPMVCNE
jgi:general secretion pathway protein G